MTLNERKFDEYISQKLKNSTYVNSEDAWDDMKKHIELVSSSNTLLFDKQVQDKIEIYQTEEHPNWDRFSNYIGENIHHNSEKFDFEVKSKLKEFNYSSSHNILNLFNKSFANAFKVKYVFYYKAIECAMIAIIFLLLFHYIPSLNFNNIKISDKPADLVSNENEETKKTNIALDKSNFLEKKSKSNLSKNLTFDQLRDSKSRTNKNFNEKSVVNEGILSPKIATSTKSSTSILERVTSSNLIEEPTNNDITLNIIFSKATNGHMNVILPSNNQNQVHDTKAALSVTTTLDLLKLTVLSPKTLAPLSSMSLPPSNLDISLFDSKHQKIQIPIKFWVGASIATVVNHIVTPVTRIGSKKYGNHSTISILEETNFEISSEFVSIEIGLNHAKKNFGYFDPKSESGHFFAIPLLIKKVFHKEKSIRPYAKAGGIFNFLTLAKSDPSQNNTITSNLAALSPTNSFGKSYDQSNVLLNKNILKNNGYFGLIIGSGIEKDINKNTKLLFEINHQFNLFDKKIGNNNHQFSTTSVAIGIKKSISI